MSIYGPEHEALKPSLRKLLDRHNQEYFRSGVHQAYTNIIQLAVLSCEEYDDSLRMRTAKLAPSMYAELPLLARFATNPEDDQGVFRITLGRVYPDSLEDLPSSRLNIGSVRGHRDFSDIAETFTAKQIESVAMHAAQVIQIDGLIGRGSSLDI